VPSETQDPGGGGHLDSKWVRMCINKIEYKGLFLNSDRVTRLGYGIRPKWRKGVLFPKVVLKRVHFRIFDKNHVKRGTF
jgi:hypothetical protein